MHKDVSQAPDVYYPDTIAQMYCTGNAGYLTQISTAAIQDKNSMGLSNSGETSGFGVMGFLFVVQGMM